MANERTPLLGGNPLPFLNSDFIGNGSSHKRDIHQEFCLLVGVPPSNGPKNAPHPAGFKRTLYGRAIHKRDAQNATYLFTAALSNTLLLTQVVLGAALTALGASESSHILITVFGALNTIIAGLVAYLKSRGQPMRARMFRDDLDRVVDEMENSEVMWLGIQQGVHGYDEIAIDDSVSVRSEVARLTRLLDKAVRSNTMNDRKSPSVSLHLVFDFQLSRCGLTKAIGFKDVVLTSHSGHVHECRWRRRQCRTPCAPTTSPSHFSSRVVTKRQRQHFCTRKQRCASSSLGPGCQSCNSAAEAEESAVESTT